MGEKISPQDRDREISNDKNPSVTTASPISKVMDFSPKVEMVDVLTAWRIMEAGLRFSAVEGGITLTSAPVSTRKRVPVVRSVT